MNRVYSDYLKGFIKDFKNYKNGYLFINNPPLLIYSIWNEKKMCVGDENIKGFWKKDLVILPVIHTFQESKSAGFIRSPETQFQSDLF